MSPLQENKVVANQYRLLRSLDSGGMGTVYLAEHLLTGQVLAVKMLKPELTNDPEVRDRFLSEAQTLAGLEHPHIVQWKNSFEDSGSYFLVMQFVEGTNVGARIEEEGYLSIEETVPIALQTLAGLDYIHRKGVVHRDLKPANLLLTKEREVKLADFGIARIVGTSRKTQPGMAIGTYVYMSPEQLLGKNADHRTDIYSLGITLYEMLAGELPFQGNTTYEVCRQHLEDPMPSILEKRPDLPPEVEPLLIRATEKDPSKRFQSAKEFMTAFTQAFPQYAWSTLKPLGLDTNRNMITALRGESAEAVKETVVVQEKPSRGLLYYMNVLFFLTLFGGVAGLGGYMYFDTIVTPPPPSRTKPVALPLVDTFENNRAGWPQGEQFSALLTLAPTSYLVATYKQGKTLSTLCPSLLRPLKPNVVVDTKTEVVTKDSQGKAVHGLTLFFARNQGKSQGLYLGINPPKQSFTVSFLQKGQWKRWVEWKADPAILKEGANHLKVELRAERLRFWINKKEVTPPLTIKSKVQGQSCVFVQQGGTRVRFHRFAVRPLVIDTTKP